MAINLGRAMEGDTIDEYPEPDPYDETICDSDADPVNIEDLLPKWAKD